MSKLQFKSTDTPIDFNVVTTKIQESGITDFGVTSIRELVKLVSQIETETGKTFIKMEMGVPGLKPSDIGTNAEIAALKQGLAAIYPTLDGYPELKNQMSRFVKLFLNIEVSANCIIPTVGTLQGSYAVFKLLSKCVKGRDTILFIDPGFPVQKMQINVLGQKYEAFDVYDFRGDKLKQKLESYLQKGTISGIIYSNPNNPTWICFTEAELKIIGDLANKYDVCIIEDLAYFGMDFRKDMSKPGEPPYQPSVANYTDNYIIMFSSSKVFSYAGQRSGLMVVSNKMFSRSFPELQEQFSSANFGYVLVYRVLYALSAGTAHTPQIALAEMIKAANSGNYDFIKEIREYGEKAKIMKEIFISNGFYIVYDKDIDEAIADGFYFTINFPGMTGSELLERLLYYGISAISLQITGSTKQGLRACVSQVHRHQFPDLEFRLEKFNEHYAL